MAIIKDLVITVNGKDAKVSNNVFLYLGDGAVTLLITVLEKSSIFGSINNATNFSILCVVFSYYICGIIY